jgi:hypothetical protein
MTSAQGFLFFLLLLGILAAVLSQDLPLPLDVTDDLGS